MSALITAAARRELRRHAHTSSGGMPIKTAGDRRQRDRRGRRQHRLGRRRRRAQGRAAERRRRARARLLRPGRHRAHRHRRQHVLGILDPGSLPRRPLGDSTGRGRPRPSEPIAEHLGLGARGHRRGHLPRSSTPTWRPRSGRSRSSAASIRATSPCAPSAAPAASTRSRSRRRSASPKSCCRTCRACSRRSAW